MSPEQALEILDQVTSKYQGNRQDHVIMAQAIEVFKKMIEENKKLNQIK